MHIFSRCFLAFATLSILALDMVYAYAIALNLTGDRVSILNDFASRN